MSGLYYRALHWPRVVRNVSYRHVDFIIIKYGLYHASIWYLPEIITGIASVFEFKLRKVGLVPMLLF